MNREEERNILGKVEVLELLRESGRPMSTLELLAKLDVSKHSIEKSVKRLRMDGDVTVYETHSHTNYYGLKRR